MVYPVMHRAFLYLIDSIRTPVASLKETGI